MDIGTALLIAFVIIASDLGDAHNAEKKTDDSNAAKIEATQTPAPITKE